MNISRKLSRIFSAIIALTLVAGVNIAVAQGGTVVDVVNDSDDHTIFAEMLAATDMDEVIAQPGPFTVVAPTDEAFEALGDELDEIRANPERMQNVVVGHLFQGEVPAADVEPALQIEIVEGDIDANNGLVHVTNQVIIQ